MKRRKKCKSCGGKTHPLAIVQGVCQGCAIWLDDLDTANRVLERLRLEATVNHNFIAAHVIADAERLVLAEIGKAAV